MSYGLNKPTLWCPTGKSCHLSDTCQICSSRRTQLSSTSWRTATRSKHSSYALRTTSETACARSYTSWQYGSAFSVIHPTLQSSLGGTSTGWSKTTWDSTKETRHVLSRLRTSLFRLRLRLSLHSAWRRVWCNLSSMWMIPNAASTSCRCLCFTVREWWRRWTKMAKCKKPSPGRLSRAPTCSFKFQSLTSLWYSTLTEWPLPFLACLLLTCTTLSSSPSASRELR